MSKYIIDETTLTGIANAIRNKDGSSAQIAVKEMASRIGSISGNGESSIFAIEDPEKVGIEFTIYYMEPDLQYNYFTANNEGIAAREITVLANSLIAMEIDYPSDYCGLQFFGVQQLYSDGYFYLLGVTDSVASVTTKVLN